MTNIIIALAKAEDAKNLKSVLVRSGYSVFGCCTSGAQALGMIDQLDDGLVICGYKLMDMLYSELRADLPDGFEMLLLPPQQMLGECAGNDIMCLTMPARVSDLVNTVDLMMNSILYKRRKRKSKPKERRPGEQNIINEAKALLMRRNNMTEAEAHRYLQKCSMDTATNLVETAQMVLSMLQ